MNTQIDTNLLRLVLLEAEHFDEAYGIPVHIDGYLHEEVNLVIQLLASHDLLVVFEDTDIYINEHGKAQDAESPIFIQRLTDHGRKFLRAVRTEEQLDALKDQTAEKDIGDVKGFIDYVIHVGRSRSSI